MSKIKSDILIFFFLYIFLLILISSNYSFHFPNDGVRYVVDAISLKKFIFNDFIEINSIKYLPNETLPIQNGITILLSFLIIFFGDFWPFIFCLLITFLNFILLKKLFVFLKELEFSNLTILLFFILLFFNFEYLKVSKSFYNEAIYIPIFYYINILIFEYLLFNRKLKNFESLIFYIFVFLGVFFRIQHFIFLSILIIFLLNQRVGFNKTFFLTLLSFSFFLIYLVVFNDVVYDRIFHQNSKVFQKLFIFLFPLNYHLILDASDYLNFNNILISNYLKFFNLILLIFLFIVFIKSFLSFKKNKKFFYYNLFLIIFSYSFLVVAFFDDERYFLFTNFNIIFFFLYSFKQIKLELKSIKTYTSLLILGSFFTIAFIYQIDRYFIKNKTYLTISIINKNFSKILNPNQFKKHINKLYDNNTNLSKLGKLKKDGRRSNYYSGEAYPIEYSPRKKIFCEIPRICFWEFYKKGNYYPISSIKEINDHIFDAAYGFNIYIGSKQYLEKNLNKNKYKILDKKDNIIICQILKK